MRVKPRFTELSRARKVAWVAHWTVLYVCGAVVLYFLPGAQWFVALWAVVLVADYVTDRVMRVRRDRDELRELRDVNRWLKTRLAVSWDSTTEMVDSELRRAREGWK